MSKEEKRLTAIQKAQADTLRKFAEERDLFKDKPQFKEFKAYLTDEIHIVLNSIPIMEKKIDQYKMQLNLEQAYLKATKKELSRLAQSAYIAQQNGIFWADDSFTIRKPAKPNIDVQTMYNQLTPEQQEKYITRTVKIVEQTEVTIDWDKVVSSEPIIYKKTLPSIAHKKKQNESGDQDYE